MGGHEPDQRDLIVHNGPVHVQTGVSVHDPSTGRFPLCAKLDGLGTVYA